MPPWSAVPDFPPPNPPAHCAEDACQGPLQPSPPLDFQGSSAFHGPGSPVPKRGKGKTHHHKKHHQKKKHKKKHHRRTFDPAGRAEADEDQGEDEDDEEDPHRPHRARRRRSLGAGPARRPRTCSGTPSPPGAPPNCTRARPRCSRSASGTGARHRHRRDQSRRPSAAGRELQGTVRPVEGWACFGHRDDADLHRRASRPRHRGQWRLTTGSSSRVEVDPLAAGMHDNTRSCPEPEAKP